jgi:MFS family permease
MLTGVVGIFCPLYTFSSFLPTIIRDLGYKNGTAQLMSVPPYVAACVVCIGLGYAADHAGQRGVFQIGLTVLA